MPFVAAALIFASPFPRARATVTTTQPVVNGRPLPGITITHETRENPPLHLHVVTIDLTNPAIRLKVSPGGPDPDGPGPWETSLLAVRDIARRDHLAVAVNGNFFQPKDRKPLFGRSIPYFAGNWARCCGWTMSDGRLFSPRPLSADWPSLVVTADNRTMIGTFAAPPRNATQIVSGIEQVVTAGRNTAADDARGPAPRTAVGLDATGRTLTLLVADGRRPDYSVGLTFKQLGEEMLARRCSDALSLDGGGSTTLVIPDAKGYPEVANRPSDGHDLPIALSVERTVADALGAVVEDDTPTILKHPKSCLKKSILTISLERRIHRKDG